MIQNRERTYINVVKGIAILFMLWGHCIQYCAKDGFNVFKSDVFQFIYSFHMPLFMLISGYLFFFSFQKRDLKTLLIHRTQGMLQPIVFASIMNLLLIQLPFTLLYGSMFMMDGGLFVNFYSLWFLWCVLSSGTAVAIAGKIARGPWMRLILMLLGIFFVALFPENEYHLYMYPFFVAGFYYGMYREAIPRWLKKCAWISLPVFLFLLPNYHNWHFIYNTHVYVPELGLRKMAILNGFRWLIGFAGSVSVLVITDALVKLLTRKDRKSLMLTMLAKLGENSLAVYCLSASLLSYYLPKIVDRIVLMAGYNLFGQNMPMYYFLFTPALAVLYAFLLYAAVLVIKKMKMHALIFGR